MRPRLGNNAKEGDQMTAPGLRLFSADSHVVEPNHCYVDYIEAKYRDQAPHYRLQDGGGEVLCFADFPPLKAGALAPSGHRLGSPELATMTLAEVNRGAFDPEQRLRDQDRDGVVGEVIYPTVAMYICASDDAAFKQSAFWAYNRWLSNEFVSHAPDRLIGLGLSSARDVDETIADVRKFKDMGFRGLMLPAEPSMDEDYDQPVFDRLWSVCAEMEMPVTFHILASRATKKVVDEHNLGISAGRGPKANRTQDVLRNLQDLIGLFIWGGVFERHPTLKIVSTEADAGWAPHYMQYADHYYLDRPDRRYDWIKRKPSEYFLENVYMTFQRDWVALKSLHMLNHERLMWANDFPHPDACWLQSQELLAENAAHLTDAQRAAIVRENVMKLYGLDRAQ
jgi:predicted TIM-barrel fold metal-dependent hydrolase